MNVQGLNESRVRSRKAEVNKMEVEEGVLLDDKAKRMRDLLSSFYSPDHSSPSASLPPNTSSRFATLDTINTSAFDADQYMNLLVSFFIPACLSQLLSIYRSSLWLAMFFVIFFWDFKNASSITECLDMNARVMEWGFFSCYLICCQMIVVCLIDCFCCCWFTHFYFVSRVFPLKLWIILKLESLPVDWSGWSIY